jgi:hypothetical protein
MQTAVAFGVAVHGGKAFILGAAGTVEVVDVTDPTAPTFLGGVATRDGGSALAVSGDGLLMTEDLSRVVPSCHEGQGAVQLIDVSDPAAPRLLWTLYLDQPALGVSVSGNTVFVADGAAGLLTLKLDPNCE